MAILDDRPTLQRDPGLERVPHFTTLQKAERRLLRDPLIKRMLSETVALCHGHPAPRWVARIRWLSQLTTRPNLANRR